MRGYKGFDKDLKCNGMQYEGGKTYVYDGKIELCKAGYHFCTEPLDVFNYYAPAYSRYYIVEAEEVSEETGDDSKRVAKKLTIVKELSIYELIEEQKKYSESRSIESNNRFVVSTGYCSTASNTGNYSTAIVNGENSVACAIGYKSKAKGALGCGLCLCERATNYELLSIKAVIVDGETVKADQYYILRNGELVEVNE